MHAAGGTVSTLDDLSKWLKFNVNQETSIIKHSDSFKELHETTTPQDKEYFTYQRFSYSLGWDIAKYRGETILTRFGGYGGISFHMSFIPSKKLGVIAFMNEDRAYLLPHLAANYLYNLSTSSANAEDIFDKERAFFNKAYDRANTQAADNFSEVTFDDNNKAMIGTYTNELGWPDIEISKNDEGYLFRWGILSGPVFHSPKAEKSYIAKLGPLDRSFKLIKSEGHIKGLINGSLKYKKD